MEVPAVQPDAILSALGLSAVNRGAYAGGWLDTTGAELLSENPATGEPIAAVTQATLDEYEVVVTDSVEDVRGVADAPRLPSAAPTSAASPTPCAATRSRWASWSAWRWARSAPRAWARSRR